MNHQYSAVYNPTKGFYQVTSEKHKFVKSNTKKTLVSALTLAVLSTFASATNITDHSIYTSDHRDLKFIDFHFNTLLSKQALSIDNLNEQLVKYVAKEISVANKVALNNAVMKLEDDIDNHISEGKSALIVDSDKNYILPYALSTGASLGNGKLVLVTADSGINMGLDGDNKVSSLFHVNTNDLLILKGQLGESEESLQSRYSISLQNVKSTSRSNANTGAISLGGGSAVLEGVRFSNNESNNGGGALYLGTELGNSKNGSFAHIVNSRFDNNSAVAKSISGGEYVRGGAIHAENGGLNIESSIFSGNHIKLMNDQEASGGAIFIENTTGRLSQVHFEGNEVALNNSLSSSYNAHGGAISMKGGSFVVENALFQNNSARINSADVAHAYAKGGAIYLDGGDFTLLNTSFKNNIALVEGSTQLKNAFGGAIYVAKGSVNIVTDKDHQSLFSGNKAQNNTNAIYLASEEVTLKIDGAGLLDVRDGIIGKGAITKNGTGEWRLGSKNSVGSLAVNEGKLIFTANGKPYSTFTVDREDSSVIETLDSSIKGDIQVDKDLSIGSIGKVVEIAVGAGQLRSSDASVRFHTGKEALSDVGSTTLVFDLQGQRDDQAAIEIKGSDPIGGVGNFIFNLTKHDNQIGEHKLLSSDKNHRLAGRVDFRYYGIDPTSVDRIRTQLVLHTDEKSISVQQAKKLEVGTATWKGQTSNSRWNVSDNNWSVIDGQNKHLGSTFMPGDSVYFGSNGYDQAVTIDASGSSFNVNGLTVDSRYHYTFEGDGVNVLGEPALKKNHGTLFVNNVIVGDFNVVGGKLIVGSSSAEKLALIRGDILVGDGTTLGGHGAVAGIATLQEGANLAVGNSLGTLTVGSLVLEKGSKVTMEISADGKSDLLSSKKMMTESKEGGLSIISDGSIDIQEGALLDVQTGKGIWLPSATYVIFKAEGDIKGVFSPSNITTDHVFLTPETSTIGKEVVLKMVRNNKAFRHYAYTYNQISTANNIEQQGANNIIYQAVSNLNAIDATYAFDNLSGELYATTESALFKSADRLYFGVVDRLNTDTQGIWGEISGSTGVIESDGNAAKADLNGANIMLGYDQDVSDNVVLGIAISHEETKVKLKEYNRLGQNNVKSLHFMAYGKMALAEYELKAGINYGRLRFNSDRDIVVRGLEGHVEANYKGRQIQLFMQGSRAFKISNQYVLTPYINVAYTDIKTKGFNESGSIAALKSSAQSNSRTTAMIGLQNEWYLDSSQNYALTVDVAYQHHFEGETLSKELSFVNGNGLEFDVRSSEVDRSSALLGLGLKASHNRMTLDIGYSGQFNNRMKNHSLGMVLKLEL